MTPSPLYGVRVLDLSSPVGVYCTRLLADLGADVVLVEPPTGDPYRRRGPFRAGASGPEASLAFGYYHANKRSVVLDLADDTDRATLHELGATADVIVISPGATTLNVSFDPETRSLPWASPAAIVCAVTPYGVDGPYGDRPATHLTSFAQGGQMWRTGQPGTPPLGQPFDLHWHLAAAHGALAVVAALGVRNDVGGQFIDISAQEVELFHDLQFESYDAIGMSPGAREAGVGIPPSGMWHCRDGVLDIAAHADRHWAAFLEMLDHPEELAEPALADMAMRRQIFDGVNALIEPLLADKSRHELFEKGQRAGLPTCILNSPSQFIADPQLEAREFWIELGRSETGPMRAPGPVHTTPRLFRTDRPAPMLGEHTEEVRAEQRDALRVVPANPTRSRALEGVRVLSFGAFVAGNTTAQLLAGLGAEVAKIEARSRPESLRGAAFNYSSRLAIEPSGVSNTPMQASLSRGTKSLSIQMDLPEGRAVFRRLVASCDVVIENFGASVMPKWGCSFADLVEINPRLIMVSLSGYGRTGPRASYLAYASSMANFTGLSEVWWPSGTYTDYVTATHAALAALAARAHVAATGQGVHIDAAQAEAFATMGAGAYLDPLVNGVETARRDNTSDVALWTHVFPCAGVDRWAAVEVESIDQWNAVCALVGRPELASAEIDGIATSAASLRAAVEAWGAPLTAPSVAHVLCRAGVPAAAVANSEEVYRDPQLRHRHFPQTFDHPDLGRISNPGSPHRMSATPGYFERSGPRLGQHTRELLVRWMGVDDAEVDRLVATQAVFDAGDAQR